MVRNLKKMLEYLIIGEHDLEYFEKGFINRFEG